MIEKIIAIILSGCLTIFGAAQLAPDTSTITVTQADGSVVVYTEDTGVIAQFNTAVTSNISTEDNARLEAFIASQPEGSYSGLLGSLRALFDMNAARDAGTIADVNSVFDPNTYNIEGGQ
jgi:hypothetical protein